MYSNNITFKSTAYTTHHTDTAKPITNLGLTESKQQFEQEIITKISQANQPLITPSSLAYDKNDLYYKTLLIYGGFLVSTNSLICKDGHVSTSSNDVTISHYYIIVKNGPQRHFCDHIANRSDYKKEEFAYRPPTFLDKIAKKIFFEAMLYLKDFHPLANGELESNNKYHLIFFGRSFDFSGKTDPILMQLLREYPNNLKPLSRLHFIIAEHQASGNKFLYMLGSYLPLKIVIKVDKNKLLANNLIIKEDQPSAKKLSFTLLLCEILNNLAEQGSSGEVYKLVKIATVEQSETVEEKTISQQLTNGLQLEEHAIVDLGEGYYSIALCNKGNLTIFPLNNLPDYLTIEELQLTDKDFPNLDSAELNLAVTNYFKMKMQALLDWVKTSTPAKDEIIRED